MADRLYTYSKKAERDLIRIYLDTANEWGMAQADKYDAGIEKAVNLLAENPNLGRQCDAIKKGYRRFDYERHIIF